VAKYSNSIQKVCGWEGVEELGLGEKALFCKGEGDRMVEECVE
jgi:hypothetical protein